MLSTAQFAFNSAVAETTKVSPFYVNYGYELKAYTTPIPTTSMAQQAIIHVEHLKIVQRQMALDIKFIQQQTARYYNNRYSVEPDLKEGGKVYLLRKNIKTKQPSNKLDYKKLGPFTIVKKIGTVNYQLKLSKNMNIHPVFHIALLEPAPANAKETLQPDLELFDKDYEIEKVLDSQLVNKVIHYLIK